MASEAVRLRFCPQAAAATRGAAGAGAWCSQRGAGTEAGRCQWAAAGTEAWCSQRGDGLLLCTPAPALRPPPGEHQPNGALVPPMKAPLPTPPSEASPDERRAAAVGLPLCRPVEAEAEEEDGLGRRHAAASATAECFCCPSPLGGGSEPSARRAQPDSQEAMPSSCCCHTPRGALGGGCGGDEDAAHWVLHGGKHHAPCAWAGQLAPDAKALAPEQALRLWDAGKTGAGCSCCCCCRCCGDVRCATWMLAGAQVSVVPLVDGAGLPGDCSCSTSSSSSKSPARGRKRASNNKRLKFVPAPWMLRWPRSGHNRAIIETQSCYFARQAAGGG